MPIAGPPRTFKPPTDEDPVHMEVYNKFVEKETAMMENIEQLWKKKAKTTTDQKDKKDLANKALAAEGDMFRLRYEYAESLKPPVLDITQEILAAQKDKELKEKEQKDKEQKDEELKEKKVGKGAAPSFFGFPNEPPFGCGVFTVDR
jgi:hypothetical protein